MMTCMTKSCQILGTHVSFGNSVSHSHIRTRRRFESNLHRRRFWVPSLHRHITLVVSSKGLKTIDSKGIDSIAQQLVAQGKIPAHTQSTSPRRPFSAPSITE